MDVNKGIDFPSCKSKCFLKWGLPLCDSELPGTGGIQAESMAWIALIIHQESDRNVNWMIPKGSCGSKILWLVLGHLAGHFQLSKLTYICIPLFQTYFIVCSTAEAQRSVILNTFINIIISVFIRSKVLRSLRLQIERCSSKINAC